jgi:hypothetical protein
MPRTMTPPAGPATGTDGPGRERVAVGLGPLFIDVAVPLGGYYLLHDGLGLGLVLSLALSGLLPAARSVLGVVGHRTVNRLAALMLAVNVAGIVLSFVTGDPRIMLAKDSGVSSVIGICILFSAFGSRPMMSAGLKPMLAKGSTARADAWDRLSAGSPRFRRLERRFSVVWGVALLTECVVRLVGAFTLPVHTMVWLSTVLTVAAVVAAIAVGGIATGPMDGMLDAATGGPDRDTPTPA